MRWTFLGHAGWLVEAAGLRLLMDPLLTESHHEGTFAVHPPRQIDVSRLRPDLVLITHRHLDHFDPPTLRLLLAAARDQNDPPPLVVTPDPLVGRAAALLGFECCVLPTWTPLRLDGLTVLPTPSFCAVREWGVLLHTADGAAWNHVDTELRSAADALAVRRRAARLLLPPANPDQPADPLPIALAVVRWQPLRQVEMILSDTLGPSLALHARQLQIAAATGAHLTLPGACGARYLGPAAWMDRHAFPLTPERFFHDLRQLRPDLCAAIPAPGDTFTVSQGRAAPADPAPFVRPLPSPAADLRFLPWSIPDLRDPTPPGSPEAADLHNAGRAEIEAWIAEALIPGLLTEAPGWGAGSTLRLALRVVYPEGEEDRTLVWTALTPAPLPEGEGGTGQGGAGEGTIHTEPGLHPDYDAAVAIAASELRSVIGGRATWGRPLLGGLLRATVRSWRHQPATPAASLARSGLPAIFLYAGLSFDLSFARWLSGEVGAELLEPAVEGGEPLGGAGGEQGLGG